MENIIEIRDLSKSFGTVRAVRDLSFSVKRGELFAFLGVNGAGKTTTIRILCGLLPPDSGTVLLNGSALGTDFAQLRGELGVVFQGSVLDSALSVSDNLRTRAALYGITGAACARRIDELSDLLDFRPLLKRPVRKLSGGQRRRIDVARALLHHPKLLILDEPTTGLDPQTRRTLWQVVNDLRRTEGMTVFLTTHYMEEAAEADHIVILDSGRIAAEGTPLALKNAYTADYITLYGSDERTVAQLGVRYEVLRDALRIFVPNTAAATALIVAHPSVFTDYEITKGKMDDVFLAVTGKKLGGMKNEDT